MKQDTPAILASRDSVAVIANITEQQWLAQRTYGNFVVKGCPPGQPYELTEVQARKGTIDLGDKRVLDFPITARAIAEDIAREVNSDAGEGSFFGVFVCEALQPTEAELDEAHAKLAEFYKRLVFTADQEWERTHNYMLITDVQRRAARALGLEKEWSYDPKPMADCPACGEKVKPGVAVCRACGAVLDREKAEQFGLVERSRPEPSGFGRPDAAQPEKGMPAVVVAPSTTTAPKREGKR
jgi:hypothetical protein